MSSAATQSQHQCSCGRTFRHGISLKRHQKVSGCPEGEVKLEIVAPDPVVVSRHLVEVGPTVDEAPTGTITAQQIARWQERTAYQAAPQVELSRSKVDWEAVRATAEEFVDFSFEQASVAGRVLTLVASLGARFTLFGGVLVFLGWLLLFGVSQDLSAAPASSADQGQAAQLSAQSTVTSFLQTAQLQQYERAHSFLSEKTRERVSAGDLQVMFSGLPLGRAPQSVSSTIEQDGRVAKVRVERGGVAEVYILVQESRGWALASVSLDRS